MHHKNWLYLAILSLVLAFCWAGVTAISKMREKTTPADLKKIMTPLNPHLDTDLFTKLQEREK